MAAGSILADIEQAAVDVGPQVQGHGVRPGQQSAQPLVEQEVGAGLSPLQRRQDAADRRGGLADARRAHQQGVGPPRDAAPQQGVHLGGARGNHPRFVLAPVLGGDQAWEDRDAARVQDEVVIAATELDPPHLHHPKPPPRRAEVLRGLFQGDDAVGDAVQLQVGGVGGAVVQ